MAYQEIMKDKGGYFLNPKGPLMDAVDGMIGAMLGRFHETHPSISKIEEIFSETGDVHYHRWTIPQDPSLFSNSVLRVSGRVLYENIKNTRSQLQKSATSFTLPFPANITLTSKSEKKSVSLNRAVTWVEPQINILDILYINGMSPTEHIEASENQDDSGFIELAQIILRELTSVAPPSDSK